MLRWFRSWGWVLVLSMLIFSGYCLFFLCYDVPPDVLEVPSFSQSMFASIGAMALTVDSPDIFQDEPEPEPEPDPEPSPESEADPAQEKTAPENLEDEPAAVFEEPETENEKPGQDTEYNGNDDEAENMAAYSEFSEFDPLDTAVLEEIRDLLKIMLYLFILFAAALIVYMILRPFWYYMT